MTQIIGTETFDEYEKLHKSNFKNFILSLDIKMIIFYVKILITNYYHRQKLYA